jgi:hypothetical protein
MNSIGKAWITPHDADLHALSLRSETVHPEYYRLSADERVFPANPTPEHPEQHVICIRLLSIDDLHMLRDVIDNYLFDKAE